MLYLCILLRKQNCLYRGLLVVHLEFEFIAYTNLIFTILVCIEFVSVSTEETGLAIEMGVFF
jgi:hypothetical protein